LRLRGTRTLSPPPAHDVRFLGRLEMGKKVESSIFTKVVVEVSTAIPDGLHDLSLAILVLVMEMKRVAVPVSFEITKSEVFELLLPLVTSAVRLGKLNIQNIF
jgi:predicted ester cyclase